MMRFVIIFSTFIIASLAQPCNPATFNGTIQARAFSFSKIIERVTDPRPLPVQVQALSPYVTPDFMLMVPLTGSFGGPNHGGLEGAVEYILAINPFFNRGFYIPRNRPTPSILPLSEDSIRFSFTGAIASNWLNQTITADFVYVGHFEHCTHRLQMLELFPSPQLTQFVLGGIRGPMDMCTEIQTNCVGPNQQYGSVLECATFMATLPMYNCNEIFIGDNYPCRYLHHLMTKTSPNIHCPHVSRNSVPCSAGRCQHPINNCKFDIVYTNC